MFIREKEEEMSNLAYKIDRILVENPVAHAYVTIALLATIIGGILGAATGLLLVLGLPFYAISIALRQVCF